MTQNEFIENAINLIFATDGDGYPLPSHQKIAKLQILTEKYKNEKIGA